MPLVSTKEMFEKAYQGGYAIGAFNVNNMEIVQGITEAAKLENSPVILQVSAGARKYAKHNYLIKLVEAAILETGLPIALHLDHGEDFEICKACIDGGFSSVMIDGSKHSFEENIAVTKQVADYAHAHGVVVEGELGKLAGIEDAVNVSEEDAQFYKPGQKWKSSSAAPGWIRWPLPSAPAMAPTNSSRAKSPACALISWKKCPAACPASPSCSTGRLPCPRSMYRPSTNTVAACPTPSASRKRCCARPLPWPCARSTSTPTCACAMTGCRPQAPGGTSGSF